MSAAIDMGEAAMGTATEPLKSEPTPTPQETGAAAAEEIKKQLEPETPPGDAAPEGDAPAEGQKAEAEGEAPKEEASGDAEAAPEEGEAKPNGFSLEALQSEFDANEGKLTEETATQLAGKLGEVLGLEGDEGSAYIDGYFEGQAAIQELAQLKAYAPVGGEEKYQEMAAWAQKNLNEADLQAHDRAVKNAMAANDMDGVHDAFRSLKSQYDAATPSSERRILNGDATGPGREGIKPITSNAELAQIASTPEYKTSPAFREEVAKRVQLGKQQGYRH